MSNEWIGILLVLCIPLVIYICYTLDERQWHEREAEFLRGQLDGQIENRRRDILRHKNEMLDKDLYYLGQIEELHRERLSILKDYNERTRECLELGKKYNELLKEKIELLKREKNNEPNIR